MRPRLTGWELHVLSLFCTSCEKKKRDFSNRAGRAEKFKVANCNADEISKTDDLCLRAAFIRKGASGG